MTMRTLFGGLAAAMFSLALLSGMPQADSHGDHHPAAGAAKSKAAAAPVPLDMAYPLDYCIVTGEPLGSMGDVVIYNHKGREIRFCCAGCISKFEAKADDYIAKIDAAIIEQQLPLYALSTCPVSGEPLDSMGGPVDIVANNRLVRLCCEGCEATVRAEPAEYIAKLDAAAIAAQLADYPATTCPVTDEELGSMGEAVDMIYAGKLVRFCCAHCIEAFSANPAEYMAKIYGK